jgi:hypothetical protein
VLPPRPSVNGSYYHDQVTMTDLLRRIRAEALRDDDLPGAWHTLARPTQGHGAQCAEHHGRRDVEELETCRSAASDAYRS